MLSNEEKLNIIVDAIIKHKKNVELPITEKTVLVELSLDSLDIVELQVYIEDTHDVMIKDPASPIVTVGDLLNLF